MPEGSSEKKVKKIQFICFLHLTLLFYSISGVCSKMAAHQPFLSARFILFFGLLGVILVVYAVLWQQVLKRVPLTTAFSNKAVTVIWGMLWGVLFFKEQITWNMLLGAGIIIAGIITVVRAGD